VISWPLAQLGELVCRPSTWNPATNTPDGSFVYVDLSAVNQETKEIVGARYMAGKDAPSRARQLVAAGDVLVSTVRPNLNSVARVQPELDGATASTGFCVLRPRAGSLDGDYLFHWVRTRQFVASMTERASGASYPAVSDRIVLDSSIPLPPLDEQRRIAEMLDRADALRAKRRAALGELDTLSQSIFDECLNSATHTERTVGELLADNSLLLHKDGNHGGQYPRTSDFVESGVPFITAKAVSENGHLDVSLVDFLSDAKAATLRIGWIAPGDVLLAHNASVGKVAFYPGPWPDALIGTSLTAFRPNPKRLDPHYLAAALRAPLFQRQLFGSMEQTTRNQVPITAQRRLLIPVCPLPKQLEFAQQTAVLDQIKRSHQASLTHLDALFASLQHRAFRGEL
jgi:type I restriction enzyme, S subunit